MASFVIRFIEIDRYGTGIAQAKRQSRQRGAQRERLGPNFDLIAHRLPRGTIGYRPAYFRIPMRGPSDNSRRREVLVDPL